MALERINEIGIASEPDRAAEIALKLGGQDNLRVVDDTIEWLNAGHHPVPVDLEIAHSMLEDLRYRSELVAWLPTPAVGESAMNGNRLAIAEARANQSRGWAKAAQDETLRAVVVTAPLRNERRHVKEFFDSLLSEHVIYPIGGIIIGDSLTTDGSLSEAYARGATVKRVFERGVAPARRAALEILLSPAVVRPYIHPMQEVIVLTDTDATVSPGLTDLHVDSLTGIDNMDEQMAAGRVTYHVKWFDRPRLIAGNVVVPGDKTGKYADFYSSAEVELLEKYADSDDPDSFTINDWDSYRLVTGAHSLGQLVKQAGYLSSDLIIGDKLAMLPGPNTALRGDFLLKLAELPDEFNWRCGTGHEMVEASIKWHMCTKGKKPTLIGLDDPLATVTASARGIVGYDSLTNETRNDDNAAVQAPGILTMAQVARLHASNGPPPYQINLNKQSIDSLRTARLAIQDVQGWLYGLRPDQNILGYYASTEAAQAAIASEVTTAANAADYTYTPALKGFDCRPVGKWAVVRSMRQ